MTRETAEQRQLRDQIAKMKVELEGISMREEYTAYVKLDRKILAAQSRLDQSKSGDRTQNLIIQYALPYGMQYLLSFALIVVSFVYRYTPALIFADAKYNFTPFGRFIQFPTGIDDAVSVPFWIFMNSYVSRHIASYVLSSADRKST